MWRQLALVCAIAGAASGATIHLTDGSTVQGEIHRAANAWIITLPDGTEKTLAVSAVQSIDLGGANQKQDLPGQLASLQRSVDLLGDPRQAVARYDAFIQRNPGTPAATKAKKEQAVWQNRLENHLVRVGGDWLTPAQVNKLKAQAVLTADHARRLIRQSKLDDAQKLVNQILEVDPHNVAGLYLDGVLKYNQNQLAEARKDFDAVTTILPNDGASWNNLAVISYRNRRFGQSVYEYDQALTADPLNQQIIDNIAEALHGLPESDQAMPGSKRLQARFDRQDAALQQKLAKQGLTRFGARWVNQEQLKQIQTAQKLVADKMKQLGSQQSQIHSQIAAIDQEIAANTQQQQNIASASYVIDPTTGRVLYASYPPQYYALGQQNIQLQSQRQQLSAKLAAIGSEMRQSQVQLPIAPYTGVQQIIGEEGTPISVPPAATQPASQ